jgi:hypothetical protein
MVGERRLEAGRQHRPASHRGQQQRAMVVDRTLHLLPLLHFFGRRPHPGRNRTRRRSAPLTGDLREMGEVAQQSHHGKQACDSRRLQIPDAGRGDTHNQDVAVVAPAHLRAEKDGDECHVKYGAGQDELIGSVEDVACARRR